jgi:hypothetical protein
MQSTSLKLGDRVTAPGLDGIVTSLSWANGAKAIIRILGSDEHVELPADKLRAVWR